MTQPTPLDAYTNLLPGDPAPWFYAASTSSERYAFDTAAGRYLVLCFFGSAQDPVSSAVLQGVARHRTIFDDAKFCFFGVSNDPTDRSEARVQASLPGIRFFWDFDLAVAKAYGAAPRTAAPGGAVPLRRFWAVLDPTLRVMRVFPIEDGVATSEAVFRYLSSLPPPDQFAGIPLQAPVLYLPNVFEPEFCKMLIGLYDADGGEESGFMREVEGKTVGIKDRSHKSRSDFNISDPQVIKAAQVRISRRIVPEIAKVHQFKVTRMERYLVGCYTAEDGGHFNAHRDNTTKGTAHRRFAVSINLNAEFEGGEVSFPEYGPRSFKPTPGSAVVFSCSLLHAVSVVTKGRRYAFLPFLYDDAAAAIREQNNQFLGTDVGAYKGT